MTTAYRDRYVDVHGVNTHYLEAGDGAETILLIHGGGVSSSAEFNYAPVIPILAEEYRVIAVDNVGYGFTGARGPEHYSAESQGEFLLRFMEVMELHAHVVGNSHGGWLCQYIAHEAPGRVGCLVIINSLNGTRPIPPEPEGFKYIFHPRGHALETPERERIRRELTAFYVNPDIVTDELVELNYRVAVRNHAYALRRSRARSATVDMLNEDLSYRGRHISEWAHELKMPVLMTWSRENRGCSPGDAMPFFNCIEDVEMHVFSNAGHHVMTEHPERWSAVVMDFCRSRPGSLGGCIQGGV